MAPRNSGTPWSASDSQVVRAALEQCPRQPNGWLQQNPTTDNLVSMLAKHFERSETAIRTHVQVKNPPPRGNILVGIFKPFYLFLFC